MGTGRVQGEPVAVGAVVIWPPVSHGADPVTSYDAEASVTASGRRSTHVAIVVAAVRETPGLTAGELGERTKLGRVEAARRLSDAKDLGLVYRSGAAVYRGTRQSLWYPTEHQASLL